MKKIYGLLYYLLKTTRKFYLNYKTTNKYYRKYLLVSYYKKISRLNPIKYNSKLYSKSRKLKSKMRNIQFNSKKCYRRDVYFINLDGRVDRLESISNQLLKVGISDYIRFPAVQNNNGALGCAYSHLEILKSNEFNDLDFIIIFEDDIEFKIDYLYLEELLDRFMSCKDLDMLLIASNNFNSKHLDDYFSLTSNAQTTAGYVAKNHMIPILIENFECSKFLLEEGLDKSFVSIDQTWKILQDKYNFVVPNKVCAFQGESYSNIENKITNTRY